MKIFLNEIKFLIWGEGEGNYEQKKATGLFLWDTLRGRVQ